MQIYALTIAVIVRANFGICSCAFSDWILRCLPVFRSPTFRASSLVCLIEFRLLNEFNMVNFCFCFFRDPLKCIFGDLRCTMIYKLNVIVAVSDI